MEEQLKKKRNQLTKEQKRVQAEHEKVFALQETERLRKARDVKTARLRALRLAGEGS